VSTGVPSRQRANAGLDQNPVTSSIIFREGAPSRDPQVLIIARLAVKAGFYAVAYPAVAIAGIAALVAGLNEQSSSMGLWLLPLYPGLIFSLHSFYERCTTNPAAIED
ncbi:hypothetical protein IU468_28755, partial [Nocardia farcinica]|uniref:hypothetical protein n=1 Tax=Nocardia farcinica TaxID=37329 RepID=UPI001894AF36